MKKLSLIIILILIGDPLSARTFFTDSTPDSNAVTDTVLTFSEYLEIVRKYHPVAKQAELLEQEAEAELLKAKGGFEPKIYADLTEKDFDEKNYYQLIDAGLKLPTWLGVDLKTGFERARGAYVDPQSGTPDAGLIYAGLSIPIGQGLFIDQRRADLKKAKIYRESNVVEQQIMLNDLMYDAGNAYWKWTQAFEVEKVISRAMHIARERLKFIERSVALGDKPEIDTLEASLQIQTLQVELQQARLEVMKSRAELSTYLWFEGVLPMELSDNVFPGEMDERSPVTSEVLFADADTLLSRHPEILKTTFKIDVLNVDRKLGLEQLKPTLNVNLTPLIEPVGGAEDIRITENNMKWGFTFEMPLLLRKQRAELQKNGLKMKSTNLDLESKRFSLSQKYAMATQEFETTREQSEQYRKTVLDYERLLNAEQRKFELGESSLFLVNSRLNKYLDSRIKLIELQMKNRKSELKTWYVLGVLGNAFNPYL